MKSIGARGQTKRASQGILDGGTNLRYYKPVNKKSRQTLEAVFAHPDRKDIRWNDFINLLAELGAEITEKGGSMVGARLNGRYAVFHRPHPGNEIYLSVLKRIRRFLHECGVSVEAD